MTGDLSTSAARRSHSAQGPFAPIRCSKRSPRRVVLFIAGCPGQIHREESAATGLHLADARGPLLARHLRRHDHAEAHAAGLGLNGPL